MAKILYFKGGGYTTAHARYSIKVANQQRIKPNPKTRTTGGKTRATDRKTRATDL